jgi:hypothetical protein
LPSSARRRLAWPLLALLATHLAAVVPGILAVEVDPRGMVAAAVGGALPVVLSGGAPSRWRDRGAAVLLGAGVIVALLAVRNVAREDAEAYLMAHRDTRLVLAGLEFDAPRSMGLVEAGRVTGLDLPVHEGIADAAEARAGRLVQFLVASGPADGQALLRLDPSLATTADLVELSGHHHAFAAADRNVRAVAVRRNGEHIAVVYERAVGDQVALAVFSPPEASLGAPRLWASVWGSARLAAPSP